MFCVSITIVLGAQTEGAHGFSSHIPGNDPGVSPSIAVSDKRPDACKKTLLPGSIDRSGRSAILQQIRQPTSSTFHLPLAFFQNDTTWYIFR